MPKKLLKKVIAIKKLKTELLRMKLSPSSISLRGLACATGFRGGEFNQ